MSSVQIQDRALLCLFTFADGRRCRTPRSDTHPHFCFFHARKEAQARAAEELGSDLSYFFSGDYVSACDLGVALGRLIPAVAKGHIKPKTASTIAYLAQTLVQTIHLSQREYINSFGTDGWRRSVRSSVDLNSEYRNPSPPSDLKESTAQTSTTPSTQTCTPATQRPTPATAPQTQQPAPAHAQPPDRPAPDRPETSAPVRARLARPDFPNQRSMAASTSESVGVRLQTVSPAPLQSSPLNAQPSPPRSDPAETAELPARSAVQTSQPATPTAQPSPAEVALRAARSMFRRRPDTTSANSFRTNIYTPQRNC